MVEASWKELVDVLSNPSLRVIVITETTGDTETMTAVDEDAATASTEEEADASGMIEVTVWGCSTILVEVLSTPLPRDTVRKETTGVAVVSTDV